MERRRIERKYLVFYLRVFEGVSGNVLGYLLDISPHGFMLVTDSLVALDRKYQLRMQLPTRSRERQEVVFSATSIWCKEDADPDFFMTGFQIEKLRQDTAQRIKGLLRDFGFERRSQPPFYL